MKKVLLISEDSENKNIFDNTMKNFSAGDNYREPYLYLKKKSSQRGYSLFNKKKISIKDADIVLIISFNILDFIKTVIYNKKTVYMMMEPPSVVILHEMKYIKKWGKIFDLILTWNDDLIDDELFFKFFLPMPYNSSEKYYKKLKFITNISGNKNSTHLSELYSERKNAIRFFEKKCPNDFDLYGTNWGETYVSYKGKIEKKINILKTYKFSICYENMYNIKGYITEKIFDCFYAKCIPIYMGADNINDYIPSNCFIDKKDFDSYDQLYDYLFNMKDSDYLDKINKINKFLQSQEFKKFLPKNFSNTIINSFDFVSNKKYNKSFYSKFKSLINLIIIYIFVYIPTLIFNRI